MTCDTTGQLRAVELETRKDTFIIPSKVAAVMSLEDGGPARLLFIGGGTIDVCGSADIWRTMIRIAELKDRN